LGMPHSVSSCATRSDVRRSSKQSSGWACRSRRTAVKASACATMGSSKVVGKGMGSSGKRLARYDEPIRTESHMIYTLGDRKLETVGEDYYVAPSAQLIGSVILGRGATVWFNCVLRADSDRIIVGDGTNIQDGTIIHVDPGSPTHLGNNVTIGHGALVHSCFIDDGSQNTNHTIVLNQTHNNRNSLIAAGALIPPDKEIPDGSV